MISTQSQNAFSYRLNSLGFCFFLMLVVDLMHEFELGVWKALFIHLLRILESVNPNLLHELDRRYVKSLCFFIDAESNIHHIWLQI
jgi:hypothetical protein